MRTVSILAVLLLAGHHIESRAQVIKPQVGWSTYGGTTDEQRFSPLFSIDAKTVHSLGPAWTREFRHRTRHGGDALGGRRRAVYDDRMVQSLCFRGRHRTAAVEL